MADEHSLFSSVSKTKQMRSNVWQTTHASSCNANPTSDWFRRTTASSPTDRRRTARTNAAWDGGRRIFSSLKCSTAFLSGNTWHPVIDERTVVNRLQFVAAATQVLEISLIKCTFIVKLYEIEYSFLISLYRAFTGYDGKRRLEAFDRFKALTSEQQKEAMDTLEVMITGNIGFETFAK